MKRALLLLVLVLTAGGAASAAENCSRETVAVRGTPVTIVLCVLAASSAGNVTTIALDGHYEAKQSSFDQRASIRFITGEGPARALQSVDLSRLGIPGVLHMTLVYSGNAVSMEHALLTPGAITIK